jgi:hypothetical protein
MPIDPEPAPDGNVRLDDSKVIRGEKVATVLSGEALVVAHTEGEDLFNSHFRTCEFARRHRGRRR